MGKKESYSMPGTAKDMEIGNEQVEIVRTMPGGGMSSGKGEEESGRMPGGGMSSGKGEEESGGMPVGDMSSGKGEEESGGMPVGSMGSGGGGEESGGDGGGEAQRSRTCATTDVHRRLLSEVPSYALARSEIENQALRYATHPEAVQRPGVTRIPVVVHVVWNTPQQNISDAQIRSQVDVLNRDFRRTNLDVNNTPAPFLPLTADSRVEFFLADVGPNGAPSTGINRRQTTVASFGSNDAVKSQATGGADAWPADRYLNIWVCQLAGGLLGYAQFPGGPAATDGVVILQSAFGTIGTAAPPFHLGRTATHEIGHWLNLNHIWGDDGTGCSGTDNVADTPNQGGANIGTPTFPNVSCNNGPNGDMFMNYMDYVDDPAMFMFTAGQVTRMQACLDGPRSSIGIEMGAPLQSSTPVVAWGANRLDAFVIGTNSRLYHKWWNGSVWGPSLTGYEDMGGTIISDPEVVAWGANRLDAFVIGTNSRLYHKWWNGSAWGPSLTGYEDMGGTIIGQPKVVAWGPNRLDVFVVGTNSRLYHKWWNGSEWGPSLTGYEDMGGTIIGSPEVVAWGPNRLDVFVVGTNSRLYHKWWNGSEWGPSLTGYEDMGGTIIGSPEVVAWGPNRLDVFVVGTNSRLYHKWWNGSEWGPSLTGYEDMGGTIIGSPEVVAWGPNRLDVFVVGTNSRLYHKWWNGSEWGPSLTGYEDMGGTIIGQPRVLAWGPNRLDVFVVGTNSRLYHKWWNGSEWGPSLTGYEDMGGTIIKF